MLTLALADEKLHAGTRQQVSNSIDVDPLERDDEHLLGAR